MILLLLVLLKKYKDIGYYTYWNLSNYSKQKKLISDDKYIILMIFYQDKIGFLTKLSIITIYI